MGNTMVASLEYSKGDENIPRPTQDLILFHQHSCLRILQIAVICGAFHRWYAYRLLYPNIANWAAQGCERILSVKCQRRVKKKMLDCSVHHKVYNQTLERYDQSLSPLRHQGCIVVDKVEAPFMT